MSFFCTPITDNINKVQCGPKRGGLVEIFVANFGEINAITSTAGDKEMDTITMLTNPITSQPYFWYRIAFKKNTAGAANEVQFGNNVFVNQTLTFTVEGITKESLAVLEGMVDGEAVFIARDYNGKTHVLGRIAGLMASAMNYGTGAAADDIYGGEITFSSEEPEFSNLVEAGTTIQVWNGTSTDTVTL